MKDFFTLRIFTFSTIFLFFSIFSKDPKIDYVQAFSQKDLYEKRKDFFAMISCLENVNSDLGDSKKGQEIIEKSLKNYFYDALNRLKNNPEASMSFDSLTFAEIRRDSTYDEWLNKRLKNHQSLLRRECLDRLEWERTKAKYYPIFGTLGKAFLTYAIGYGAGYLEGALFTAAQQVSVEEERPSTATQEPYAKEKKSSAAAQELRVKGIAGALYHLKDATGFVPSLLSSESNDPIKELEELFACNKCYIPNELWPSIIKAFILAHKDELNSSKHINFVDYALGFTVYKPKPAINLTKNSSIDDIKQELGKRIDTFFLKNYEFCSSQQIESLELLKLNIYKFIDSLQDQNGEVANNIYLHGPGGIGKTYFIKELFKWIDELMPSVINFENLVIDSAEKLEGSAEYAGVFLNVLHNQLVKEKSGSLVMLDEASWLGQRLDMSDAIKRTFDVKNKKIFARCLGSGLHGPIAFEKPNMLVMLAGNMSSSKIQDKALAGRFLNFKFPNPTMSMLSKHAFKIIQNSKYVNQKIKSQMTEEDVKEWIRSLPEQDRNFRFIEHNAEICCKPTDKKKLDVKIPLVESINYSDKFFKAYNSFLM